MKHAQCGKITPHQKHTWRDDWFFMFRRILCSGVKPRTSLEMWQMANPSIGTTVKPTFIMEGTHKHLLKFKGLLAHSNTKSHNDTLVFKCDRCDRDFPYEIRITRWAYEERVMKHPEFDQTWPG